MFRNYFKTAIRNLWRHKIFSLINISGLSIGISAALVIFLIAQYEFSYDTFHRDRERIFRVVTNMTFPGLEIDNSGVPTPLASAVRSEIPGIEASTAFISYSDPRVAISSSDSAGLKFQKQQNVVFADPAFFNLLDYEWIAGDPSVLKEPFRVVLTTERVKAYFNDTDPKLLIGKAIVYNDSIRVTLAGIVKNLPGPTDFNFKEFISLATIPNSGLKSEYSWGEWGSINSSSQFLVKLDKGVVVPVIERQLAALLKKYTPPEETSKTTYLLQAFNDIHFNPRYDNFNQRQAHLPTLYGLLTVAAFLLLLGCINFINLTTAQSVQRSKEIGVRKTMGSSKAQLIVQFLGETFLITSFATILSFALAPLILKVFADYVPPELVFDLRSYPIIILFAIGLIVIVTILAGLYPAFVLSKYKPVSILKSQATLSGGGTRKAFIRKGLTITQFAIAQVFIVATIVVGQQIKFGINKDLGFNKDAIIFFDAPYNEPDLEKRTVLLNKLRLIPGIEKLSLAGNPPASVSTWTRSFEYPEGGKEKEVSVELKFADTSYFRLYGMKLLAGRNLIPSDTAREFVINETYSKFLGFPDPAEALGKIINGLPIVGVLADFHTKGVQEQIKPLAFSFDKIRHRTYHLQMPTSDISNWTSTLGEVKRAFQEIYPEGEFNQTFFDESIARFYKTEHDMGNFLRWAAGLAIFISCLGLLGLVIYTTHQRIKEIGVRKVLGASVSQIVTLLSKDFVLLVLIAFAIAAPLAWYLMSRWLEGFAYRTNISWWIFLISGAGMMLIALLTLSAQVIRAANGNPVRNLRSE